MDREFKISWDAVFPSLTARLRDCRDQQEALVGFLARVFDEVGEKLPFNGDGVPERIDPFSFISCIATLPTEEARREALEKTIQSLGLPAWHLGGSEYLQPLEESPYLFEVNGDEAPLVDALWDLYGKEIDIADSGQLIGIAGGRDREEFAELLQTILDREDPRASLARVSQALAWIRPQAFLSLHAPVLNLLTAENGLRIPQDDIPTDARGYLGLIQFLDSEMDAVRLPYMDFAQMGRAADAGLSAADGLTIDDRWLLVDERIRPYLKRLLPDDDARVDAECRRLRDLR